MTDPTCLTGAPQRASLALVLLASLGAPPLLARAGDSPAAEPVEAAPAAHLVEARANEFTSSAQEAVALAADPAGRTLVAWQSRRQEGGTYGVYARLYSAAGAPLTGEVHVNATTAGMQTGPAAAFDAAGGAWLAWESFGQDGDRGAVIARRFDARLESAGAELLVNATSAGHQGQVALDAAADGSALFAWQSIDGAGVARVCARLLGADGAPRTDELVLGGEDTGGESLPCVVALRGGGFAVAWARVGERGTPAGVFVRRLDAAGTPLGAARRVSPDGDGIEPALAALDDGRALVAWLSARGEGYEPRLRTLDWSGGALELGRVRDLEHDAPGYVSGLALAGRADGGATAAWSRFGDEGQTAGLFSQTLDREGAPEGAPRRATAATAGHQRLAVGGARRASYAADGRLALAWCGDAGLGDGSGAHLTVLLPEGCDTSAGDALPARAGDANAHLAQGEGATEEEGASPHEPPTFDPALVNKGPRPPVVAPLAPGMPFGFIGVQNTGWTPPDPHLASGPNHVVEVTNGAIAFFGHDGSFQFQDMIEGPTGFWGSLGATGFVFDPEVAYDPHSGRFMAMACERASNGRPYFLFALSDDSDPNGTWHKYRFDVISAAGGDTDIDSPNLAVDATTITLTADFFGPDKFLVFIIDKASVLSGGAASTTSMLVSGSQSYGTPVTYGTPPRQYMIEAHSFGGSSSTVTLHAIDNPLTAPSLTSFALAVPTYGHPEDPPQLGTTVRPETFEARFWSCVYRDGFLWATHHVNSARVRQRWYQIDMANWPVSGTPTLVDWGEVDPGGTARTFFGSIWVDANQTMALVFAHSSPTEPISMACTYRLATDPAGTTRPMEILKTSATPSTSGRWGDYSSVVSDTAAPGTFWGVHEFHNGIWDTWIVRFDACAPPATYCTTSPNSAGPGALIGFSGTTSVSAQDFTLTATGAPPNQRGIFFYGPTQISTPFGQGVRCVGDGATGVFRLKPSFDIDGAGDAAYTIDWNAAPVVSGPGMITPGSTWYFQFWYRDPGFGFNLSDGLCVEFCD